jgi:lysozyme family protein
MARFDDCLVFVLAHEGGYVNDPADPGGATNHGITQATYDAYRTKQGLLPQPVELLEDDEAEGIYRLNYWLAAKCDQLPAPLDLIHFDSAVNVGVATANRMLQTALNMGIVDGVVGQRTLFAANQADPILIGGRYCNLRITRYIVISATTLTGKRFLAGWFHRVADLLRAI